MATLRSLDVNAALLSLMHVMQAFVIATYGTRSLATQKNCVSNALFIFFCYINTLLEGVSIIDPNNSKSGTLTLHLYFGIVSEARNECNLCLNQKVFAQENILDL